MNGFTCHPDFNEVIITPVFWAHLVVLDILWLLMSAQHNRKKKKNILPAGKAPHWPKRGDASERLVNFFRRCEKVSF